MEIEGTTVSIYGQQYTVRAGVDPEHVREIAAFVDAQMREAAKGSSQVSSLRIAVLAALNIAEELYRERAEDGELQQRAERLVRSLESNFKP